MSSLSLMYCWTDWYLSSPLHRRTQDLIKGRGSYIQAQPTANILKIFGDQNHYIAVCKSNFKEDSMGLQTQCRLTVVFHWYLGQTVELLIISVMENLLPCSVAGLNPSPLCIHRWYFASYRWQENLYKRITKCLSKTDQNYFCVH